MKIILTYSGRQQKSPICLPINNVELHGLQGLKVMHDAVEVLDKRGWQGVSWQPLRNFLLFNPANRPPAAASQTPTLYNSPLLYLGTQPPPHCSPAGQSLLQ